MTELSNNSKFYGQDFDGLAASEQQFSAIEFDSCTFNSCDFSEASFLNCEFTDCRFVDCNLSVLNVHNSKFVNVEFSGCKALGINWTRAFWRGVALGEALIFKRSMINSSSFNGLKLPKLIIEGCRAHDVDFREANLSGASFADTDLSNSLFHHTNLMTANFSESTNYEININNNQVKGATFCRYEAVRLLTSLGINLVD